MINFDFRVAGRAALRVCLLITALYLPV